MGHVSTIDIDLHPLEVLIGSLNLFPQQELLFIESKRYKHIMKGNIITGFHLGEGQIRVFDEKPLTIFEMKCSFHEWGPVREKNSHYFRNVR